MTNLYPIKFEPVIKERIWGGDKLVKLYSKDYGAGKAVGESWEISSVRDDYSVIENGFLKGNNIVELLETYMGDIVGDRIYEKFGNEFPLLIKFLDINDKLSVQVHPNDKIAAERHQSYGKSECWYIIEAKPKAKIYLGFNRNITWQEFEERCKNGTIEDVLNSVTPKAGDFFFVAPGTVHSAGGGVLMAEIQQTSDITYRVFDWGRENDKETAREMHLELAKDCINYDRLILSEKIYKKGIATDSQRIALTDSEYFKVDKIRVKGRYKEISSGKEGFVIYLCISGDLTISFDGNADIISAGETILIPASMGEYYLENLTEDTELLEITGKI